MSLGRKAEVRNRHGLGSLVKSVEYLAGLFDGEGSFSIQVGLRQRKSNPPSIWFNPCLSMTLYYGREVLELLQERLGGKCYVYPRSNGTGGRWCLGQKEKVLKVAKELQPHLEIKKDICGRFIQALELFPAGKRINNGRVWSPDVAVAVAEIALTLNPPRSRKSNKTLEYLTVFKKELERNNVKNVISSKEVH